MTSFTVPSAAAVSHHPDRPPYSPTPFFRY
jgi:hypothetical protein